MAEAAHNLVTARAEALGARLPPLVVKAERIAATVMQGVHGRRRSGQGDAFWQFRPYLPGDAAARVDWRQSARSDRVFIRETEWEAAQTVALWSARGPGMGWRSRDMLPLKQERAEILLLALAALLLRGGERVRGFGAPRAFIGRAALAPLAGFLPEQPPIPADPRLPRHARVVLFSDFLAPLEETRAALAGLAAQGLRGHLLQILDPAEETLPFAGHIRFEDPSGGAPAPIPRTEALRGAYQAALARHRDGLAAMALSLGFSFATHRTDQPPELALLALFQWLEAG
ncbi:MAG: DUF58 domain-containing protein [Acetobacteraceae bacterium]|nr:DUF58 domain-containing protein [Acetobacteraceae bacterium]